jgi:DNA-binding CsgD family transcriptional regulator
MKQIEVRVFPSGQGWPIAEMRQTPSELEAQTSLKFEDDLDDLGEYRCAAIWNPTVGQIYLEGRPHPEYKGVTVYVDTDTNRTEGIWALEDELGIKASDLEWVTDQERSEVRRRNRTAANQSVRELAAGLSNREIQIATAASTGSPVRAIAKDLDIAPSTVSGHLQRIYLKLGVHSRAQLKEALNKYPHFARSA